MKRRLTMAITLVFLLSTLTALSAPAYGQTQNPPRPRRLSSGLMTLDQNQSVSLTLANAATNPNANDRLTVRLNVRILHYAPTGPMAFVNEMGVVGQTSSGPITIAPGGAASIDFDLSQATNPNVQGFLIIVEALPLAGTSNEARASANLTVKNKFSKEPLSIWVWSDYDGGYVWM